MFRNFQKLVVLFRALGFKADLFDDREDPADLCQVWVEISKDNLMFQVWKFGYQVKGIMYPYEVHFYKDGHLVDDTLISESEFGLIGLIWDYIYNNGK